MLATAKALVRSLIAGSDQSMAKQIPEADAKQVAILERVRAYTMTSRERVWGVLQATAYVHARGIPGDFVECGVWRGGSAMAAALGFLAVGSTERTLWLYDTYQGMPEPTDADRKVYEAAPARQKWEQARNEAGGSDWCLASLEDVKRNLTTTGYPNLRFVEGKVEDTLPGQAPETIAILRLDTDWYASTKVELEHLWPRLSPGGVLIIDDYGEWAGQKQAVDEFFKDKPAPFMHRLDYTGRLILKV